MPKKSMDIIKGSPKKPAKSKAPSKSSSARKSTKSAVKEKPLKSESVIDFPDLNEELETKKSPKLKNPKKPRKPRKKWSKKKKIIVFSLITTFVLVLAFAGFMAWKILSSVGNSFNGNASDFLTKSTPLKTDQYGRSNILIFGTSEDDPGHSGAELADSIMVLSVNKESKRANMISIPRDLWVDYGVQCSVGFSGKVNAAYMCGLESTNDPEAASMAFAKVVSGVIGTEIQYYAAVNYSVVRDLTDALGGIDVDIYSDDPRGIYDVRLNLTLPAGVNHLDGKTALDLSRARNSKGGYGLTRSNFDREKNQQRIIKGMQKKALSAGVLTDPSKVLKIFESLGNNIKSNLEMSELRSALDIAVGLSDDSIVSLPLTDKDIALVTTDHYNGQSIVRPTAGLTDFSQIHEYIKSNFVEPEETSESE